MRIDWPDFGDKIVVIAASGPSQRANELERILEAPGFAAGRILTIAINETWRLAMWADCLYGCDPDWWDLREPVQEEFRGLRLVGYGERAGCIPCRVQPHAHMIWDGERLGGGANSGYQALNLAAACGARRVVLTGFDCMGPGEHWHGRHQPPLRSANAACVAKWIEYFDAAAPVLLERGVEVINASVETALTCFPRATITEAIAI